MNLLSVTLVKGGYISRALRTTPCRSISFNWAPPPKIPKEKPEDPGELSEFELLLSKETVPKYRVFVDHLVVFKAMLNDAHDDSSHPEERRVAGAQLRRLEDNFNALLEQTADEREARLIKDKHRSELDGYFHAVLEAMRSRKKFF